MLLHWRVKKKTTAVRCVSRTIHDLSVWNKPLIHTYQYCSTSRANHALRSLANAGFQNRRACLQAFPSFLPLPLLSFFGCRFIFRAVKTENLVPLSFFAPKLNGNACYAGYATLPTKGANPLPHASSLTKIVTFFFGRVENLQGGASRVTQNLTLCLKNCVQIPPWGKAND